MPQTATEADKHRAAAQSTRIKSLEEQVRRLSHANDGLRSRFFTESQRGNRIAQSMDFGDIDELEANIAARPHVFKKSSIEQAASLIERLETQIASHVRLDKAVQDALAEARREMDQLQMENERLRAEAGRLNNVKEVLQSRVTELEAASGSQQEANALSTGLPTPATVAKQRPLVLSDVTPRNAPSALPPITPGPLVVTPTSSRLPPLALSAESESDPVVLRAELRMLHTQYEVLRLVKERAEAKYRADYMKWRNFKRWMFDEEKTSLSEVIMDGKTPNLKNVMRVRRRYMKSGPRTNPAEPSQLDSNDSHYASNIRHVVADLPDTFESTSPKAQQSSLTARLLEVKRPSAPVQGETSLNDARKLPGGLISSAVSLDRKRRHEEQLEPVAATSPATPRRKRRKYDDSSETEDETQALEPMLESQPGLHRLVPMPDGTYVRRGYVPAAENAEASASAAQSPRPPLTPRKPKTPSSRHSRGSPTKTSTSSRHSTPRKRRGLSATPTKSSPGARTCVEKENPGPSTAQRRTADYSAYKGHGRYAASAKVDKDSINAMYEIDTDHNAGVGHQFSEVVRDREGRRRLHGDDCECCREYYKAVGKLPPRLQAPLWRSPHATPTKSSPSERRHLTDAPDMPNSPRKARHVHDPCFDDESGEPQAEEQAAIEAHMQQISRHRQQWERPKTPPGYWEIAFPDTQEAAAINKRAKEMHAEKRAKIETEANRGGRYRKRKS